MTKKTETQILIEKFNKLSKHENSIVRLRYSNIESAVEGFELYYLITDPFIQKRVHRDGCAVLYISDTVRGIIEGYAMGIGKTVGWNNTGTRGHLK